MVSLLEKQHLTQVSHLLAIFFFFFCLCKYLLPDSLSYWGTIRENHHKVECQTDCSGRPHSFWYAILLCWHSSTTENEPADWGRTCLSNILAILTKKLQNKNILMFSRSDVINLKIMSLYFCGGPQRIWGVMFDNIFQRKQGPKRSNSYCWHRTCPNAFTKLLDAALHTESSEFLV